MNRQDRRLARAIMRRVARDPECPRDPMGIGMNKMAQLAYITSGRFDEDLSLHEQAVSAALVERLPADTVWWHGGLAGRDVGDWLLPGAVTGSNPRDMRWRLGGLFTYVTHHRHLALHYAQQAGGVLYRVEPERPLGVDPHELRTAMLLRPEIKAEGGKLMDLRLNAYTCPRARVLEVIQ